MLRRKVPMGIVSALILTTALPEAQAVMPVVDVRAISQLVTQIRTLQDQLNTARNHLTQARQQFESMTGGRGMERLLSGTVRNYLPADWTQLADALAGPQVRDLVNANAVLTGEQLNFLSPQARAFVADERQAAALRQATTRAALETTSSRFQSIQRLIDTIPAAADQKAVLDLQARIQAELGMLQNEHTKLQMLEQVSQAEESARKQRQREMAIAGYGHFVTRFRPSF